MTDSFILDTDSRGIATLTLNRPDIRNAFDDALIEGLTKALEKLATDKGLRALVLTGEGKAFSAGADLNWMRRMAGYSEAENKADSIALGRLMHTLYNLPFPTIAKVNGPALGGGVGLVACCDMAIGHPDAFFALSEVRLGLVPAVISPFVIKAIGSRNAHRYFQTAERFTADEAATMGLLHEVTGNLDEAVEKLIENILSCGPEATRASKKLIRDVEDKLIDDQLLDDTADVIAKIRVSPEGQEGLTAFLEKRKPGWSQ